MRIDRKKALMPFALTLLIVSSVFISYNINSSVQAATQAEIDDAVTNGMTWLAAQQNIDGSWGTMYQVAKTGFAVLKFETHAIQNCTDPLDLGYQYYAQIRNGLDYIFANAYTMSISMQPAGNPDTDGDGIGVYFVSGGPSGMLRTYETGVAMMALAASTHPEMVVTVPGSAVNGWTYKDVLQDAVDYLAFGQNDAGLQRGGWGYSENDGYSDNSNTGYAVLGLAYAKAPTIDGKTGFACTIPAFVKSELIIWISYIQNAVNGDTNDGGSGYSGPDDWVNILKTGHLLFEMAFYGDTAATQRVQDAIDYLVRHWNDANDDPGWKGAPGGVASYQAMYTTMKGLEILGIDVIDGIDWFDEFSDVLVAQQNPDGSWPGCLWDDGELILSSEWALLTLQKAAPPPPPEIHGCEDLELYPRDVVDLEDPYIVGTQWHELHPEKFNYYKLLSWEPGMVLSPEDLVLMSGKWFQVDDVTIDIVITDLETENTYWLDYECGYWTFDPEDPICTKWNEIKSEYYGPPEIPRCWHLTSWKDNGDGRLSYCDIIDMKPFPDLYYEPYPGPTVYFHVELVTITLKLTEYEAFPPFQYYLEFMGTLEEFEAMDCIHYPLGTWWHEIWPVQGREWELRGWSDTPFLSPSDQIWLALKDEFGEPIPGTEVEYHVDKLTVAMNITAEGHDWHIVKFEGSLKQFKNYHWYMESWPGPFGTQWLEVNPDYCRQWYLSDWEDNGDYYLGYDDYIEMIDKETGDWEWFYVESISTDMWLTVKHDVAVTDVTVCCGATILHGGVTAHIPVTVENQGYSTETFGVTAYWNTTVIQTVVVTLPSGASTSRVLNWTTTGLTEYDYYDIWAYAGPVTGEADLSDNKFTYGLVQIVHKGDVNADGKVRVDDILAVALAFGTNCGQPGYNPHADINCDGKIRIDDVLAAALEFGWGP